MASSKMNKDPDNSRHIHKWSINAVVKDLKLMGTGQNDGIFAMELDDFMDFFSQITVCRPF